MNDENTILERCPYTACRGKDIDKLQAALEKHRWIPVVEIPKVERHTKFLVYVQWDKRYPSDKIRYTWEESTWNVVNKGWEKWDAGNTTIIAYKPIILPEQENAK
jgi:hypothetical protein